MSAHNLFKGIDISAIPKGSYIIEVGSIRETSCTQGELNSTTFFCELAKANSLEFLTVDFSPESHSLAKQFVGNKAVLSDGAKFLSKFNEPISVLYLDNFDVIYNDVHKQSLMKRVGSAYKEQGEDITNQRSAEVHLEQLKQALLKLTTPSFVCIDDTMIREGQWWGKGAYVVPFLLKEGYHIIQQGADGVLLSNRIESMKC